MCLSNCRSSLSFHLKRNTAALKETPAAFEKSPENVPLPKRKLENPKEKTPKRSRNESASKDTKRNNKGGSLDF